MGEDTNMADENKMRLSKQVYQTLCKALDNRGWSYKKEQDRLLVYFGVNGDSMPIQVVIVVDASRQLIRLMSPLPFKMSESKRADGAIATCAVSYGMADGSFDYDLDDGTISFRMTEYFENCLIDEDLFNYMIDCSCAMVERYADRFLALEKGNITITDLLEQD